MSENQFGPHDGESDERTRVSYPRQQETQQQSAYQTPSAAPSQAPPQGLPQGSAQGPPQGSAQQAPQQQPAQQFAPAGYQAAAPYGQGGQQAYQPAARAPRPKAGYFRSLFDLSYDNLGAPKFARVFQLLFMIVSGLAALIMIVWALRTEQVIAVVLAIVVVPLLWLLLNTFVRLVLEAVVGIVQTAENSEAMLEIMRERGAL